MSVQAETGVLMSDVNVVTGVPEDCWVRERAAARIVGLELTKTDASIVNATLEEYDPSCATAPSCETCPMSARLWSDVLRASSR